MVKILKTATQSLPSVKRQGEEFLARQKAKKFNYEYLNLDLIPLNINDLALISEADSKKWKIAVARKSGKELLLAAVDPSEEGVARIVKDFEAKGLSVRVSITSIGSLRRPWKLYGSIKAVGIQLEKTIIIGEERAVSLQKELTSREALVEQLKQSRDITSFLEVLFIGGVNARASDMHLEPEERKTLIRFRIDGVLQDIFAIERGLYESSVTRIKIVAQLKLNVKDTPQDGRMSVRQEGKDQKDIEARVSVIPSSFGETIVIRLLGTGVEKLSLDGLGVEPAQRELLESALALPNGMIVSTGPTGSGKTTTLYAALNSLRNPEINIITIENPIEYKLEGITQTQINKSKGYTFSSALRSVLRQDPDIVMVGEIRDEETADIAINAALTGHLVLSTLHTNDAPSTIERLENLKVRLALIPTALKLVIAQRLARKLCEHCKKSYQMSKEEAEAVSHLLSLISPKANIVIPKDITNFWKSVGCNLCFGTGYFGQTGIFEFFLVNDVIEKKVLAQESIYELRKVAMENGMVTLLQHGVLRALRGETSLEEVKRVAGDIKYIEEMYGKTMMAALGHAFRVKEDIGALFKESKTLEDIGKVLLTLEEKDLLSGILEVSLDKKASDINIEPTQDALKIELRIDGVLHPIVSLPHDYAIYVTSSIKEQAGLALGEHANVQEGRFAVERSKEGAKTVDDIRVSIIPGGYGEAIVLRVLASGFEFSLENLGISPFIVPRLVSGVQEPQGMILTTGPTGSGKTTTLYSLLKKVDVTAKRVMTIEDPIEYTIEGAIQTQINTNAGFGFEEAFRAILRQAPNVIMVGEIRDAITARIAIEAALSGHLVLSTLHANDALSVVERFKGLEVEENVFLQALTIVLAQRLVRKLCEHCKKTDDIPDAKKEIIKTLLERTNPMFTKGLDREHILAYKAEGCEQCFGTGRKGRLGVYEFVSMSEDLRELIKANSPRDVVEKKIIEDGGIFLNQDAAIKITMGIASLDEVERVVGEL